MIIYDDQEGLLQECKVGLTFKGKPTYLININRLKDKNTQIQKKYLTNLVIQDKKV